MLIRKLRVKEKVQATYLYSAGESENITVETTDEFIVFEEPLYNYDMGNMEFWKVEDGCLILPHQSSLITKTLTLEEWKKEVGV
jgi:hypothetical protein